ncbi:cell fate (sporulation/competence/biofilm development) regulator YmcA (YheA/YmcA/DUF963 family)/ElaB/YqjD/DUF883 family membrane-anchored ribosome-binding protein [Ereboglobus sp. PH5-10]|uniref:hypothetical protein n=1 Tax=Ereboglobus sp. PH5-10 TaxID=2940629 RepID=UPI0024051D3E|nr:hypothetical protein [Ereboglobus sp. PH5-10]MDF9826565.1 cell fate (sporulation/competence/biofilm development) regulator YmcA (YheA/YmcA/DUF963 family)/ElaB/YqjD/DUF883 family membrane-anchored ribosome-binding protein [Ereboglobus sp. PH5-10]
MATPKQLKLPYTHAQWSAYKKNARKKNGADLTTKVDFGPRLKKIESLFGKIQWTELEAATGDKIDGLCARQLAPVIEAVRKLADDIKTEAVIPAGVKKQIIPGFLADLINYEKSIKEHCNKLDAKIERDMAILDEAALAKLVLSIKKLIKEADDCDEYRLMNNKIKNTRALPGINNRIQQLNAQRDDIQKAIKAFEGAIRNLSKRLESANKVQRHKFEVAFTIHKTLRQSFERLNSKLMELTAIIAGDMKAGINDEKLLEKTQKTALDSLDTMLKSAEAARKELASIVKSKNLLLGKTKKIKKNDFVKLASRIVDRLNSLNVRVQDLSGRQMGHISQYVDALAKKEPLRGKETVAAARAKLNQFGQISANTAADIDEELKFVKKLFKANTAMDVIERANMSGTNIRQEKKVLTD